MKLVRTETSPLLSIDTSFAHYLERRRREEQAHLDNGVPDYAFALDYQLRQRLGQIPQFYNLCKKVSATIETRNIQLYNQKAISVTPNQYPEIYSMGVDCARRLGIGVPNIFIYSDTQMNAFTYASDDVSPMIVLHTGIIDRMNPNELKCVIAHECGHIHNQHLIYKNVIRQILSSNTGLFGVILSVANIALMQFWTRACEITADRASLICGNDIKDSINVQAKLLSGATFNQAFQHEFDIDALREQLNTTIKNTAKIYEILSDHPSAIRRIFCIKEFEECEIFYKWRTELRKPDSVVRSKSETDYRCQQLINIMSNNDVLTFDYPGIKGASS